jgi:TPR repeat protein
MDEADLHQGADMDNAAACNQLGHTLLQQVPSAPDSMRPHMLVLAFHYFDRAAHLGDAEGMWNVGWRYWLGEGTTKDLVKAVSLWQQAAEKGYLQAVKHLRDLQEHVLSQVDGKVFGTLPEQPQVIQGGAVTTGGGFASEARQATTPTQDRNHSQVSTEEAESKRKADLQVPLGNEQVTQSTRGFTRPPSDDSGLWTIASTGALLAGSFVSGPVGIALLVAGLIGISASD